jgi:hypothetical protein
MKKARIVTALAAVVLLAVTIGTIWGLQNTHASELKGTIETLSGNSSMIIGNKTIFINDSTKIKGTLAAGVTVEIKAIVQDDGSLLAVRIEAKENASQASCDDCDDDCRGASLASCDDCDDDCRGASLAGCDDCDDDCRGAGQAGCDDCDDDDDD